MLDKGPDRTIPSDQYHTWEVDGTVKLRQVDDDDKEKDKDLFNPTPISIPTFVRQICALGGNRTALASKRAGDDKWVTVSFTEYYRSIRQTARAFIHLGLEPFHSVAILGFNSPEWFLSCLGAIFAGGFSAGLYPTNSAEMNLFIMNDSRAQILVCEDGAAVERMWGVRDNVSTLKKIVQYSGVPSRPGVLSWQDLMDLVPQQQEKEEEKETAAAAESNEDNDDNAASNDDELEQRLRRMAINHCAVLIYTSGTTGNPKGAMLSHDNVVFSAKNAQNVLKLRDFEEVVISYLPLSHIAGLLTDIFGVLAAAGTVYFANKSALKDGTLINTIREVRPTVFMGVPRVFEKIMEGMQDRGRDMGEFKRKVSAAFRQAGLQRHTPGEGKRGGGVVYQAGKKLFYRKVKEALGMDRCRHLLCGGAPLSPDTMKYFLGFDMYIEEAYGMSESSGMHTMTCHANRRFGSVGKTMPSLRTKLISRNSHSHSGGSVNGEEKPKDEKAKDEKAKDEKAVASASDEDGEFCMWGRNVMMGYLGLEEKTKEDLDDEGWMRSGDLASVDDDGFYYITGRIKELLITSGGENIAPQPIEERIKLELQPIVSNAILVGDRRKFLSIFLTLKTVIDKETQMPTNKLTRSAAEWCQSQGGGTVVTTVEEVLESPDNKIMSAVQAGIDRANARAVSSAARVQKWSVLPVDLSVGGGELGPSLKLKRFEFSKKYAEEIEKFYK